jgi:hypothetical protein
MAAQIFSGRCAIQGPEPDGLAAVIAPPPHGTTAERLHVYVAGYPARVYEALAEGFPAVAHVVGAGAFAALAERYAVRVPLDSRNLNDAGAALAEFLADDALTRELPFLPDLAALEWRVLRAFHAADVPPLDARMMADWDVENWEHAVLQLQPSVGLVRSAWPIREIWATRDTPLEEIDVALQDRPEHVLIRRHGFAVHCECIGAEEADALAALLSGQRLGDVAAALAARGGDPESVGTWFARWMAWGVIAGCTRS